jgi:hypothetical protein
MKLAYGLTLVYRTLANLRLNFPNDVREMSKRFALLTRARFCVNVRFSQDCVAGAVHYPLVEFGVPCTCLFY